MGSVMNVINMETGEILENVIVETIEEKKDKKDHAEKDMEKKLYYKEYGTFYYLLYDNKLFDTLDGATLTRLLYLATYIPYGEYILKIHGKPITKDRLQKILNISKRSVYYFIDLCTKNNILSINEKEEIVLSKEYFHKGKFDKEIRNKIPNVTRINIETIRRAYVMSDHKRHKQMAYFFRLIPYVNKKFNIITHNPLETDFEKLNFITLKELAEMWGIEYNKHLTKFRNDLWHCRIVETELLINFIPQPDLNKWIVGVNPKVFYGGTDIKEAFLRGEYFHIYV